MYKIVCIIFRILKISSYTFLCKYIYTHNKHAYICVCIYILNIVYSSGVGTSSYHNLTAGKLQFFRPVEKLQNLFRSKEPTVSQW